VIEQLGLFDPEPISIGTSEISPRQMLHELWEPQIKARPDTKDFILIHIEASGTLQGQPAKSRLLLIHRFDEETGFTAMEQATGWHAAIMTEAIAKGHVRSGVVPVERAMNGSAFVEQAALRGFQIELTLE
jgi:saccharopine dehydrogenase-like NADP-dependent oxidoreductase